MSEMSEAIRELIEEKGVSVESVKQTVESAIKAAYKKTFGTADNCEVHFADDLSDVSVYSKKVIVDGVYDPVTEIELEDALKMSEECEVGDEILILVDPKTFERSAVSTGKQAAHQGLSESFKNNLLAENKGKIGEVIIGYYQREHNGNIYVDLGKVEGVLPKKYQSSREIYQKNDRIKAIVVDVKPTSSGVQLVLSRTDPKFVQSIIELEVPELEDKTIGIYKIVREAGYRTKIAVFSNKEDVDPVGACVGLKGVRIQNVIRELEGEKIDVLRYDQNPVEFIKNALSPAEVEKVLITDEEKKQALAIVNESQFSLAIGKSGMNVRLANRLCDWSIDVKTEEQAAEMDLSQFSTRKAAENLFNNSSEKENAGSEENEPISTISELPGVDVDVASKLKAAGFDDIQTFVDSFDSDSIKVEGVTQEDLEKVNSIVRDVVEFVEDDSEKTEEEKPGQEEEEEYFCPECGAKITLDMTKCPKCGVEFEFE
ncbi:NusA antitermination factor [Treponema berlinense]|jgi:N utilization substance protein A|uniref:Transcription termination/antitermination protein NusA n=2 Tax=Treponema berlinense TaxID=225004 RepID=A0A1T4NUP4_9SPIR|nr:transcription termination factor NusA [Treponema berlinense]SJZ82974.1 NusA antitermination factor [Treponema berlinense]